MTCDMASPLETKGAVAEIGIDDVLKRLKNGEKIVFVDTRERSEYDDYHIPGAIRLPLREVRQETLPALAQADLVVPYCVKDFSGLRGGAETQ